MKQITYFAVFEPCSTGYGVCFPDLPGCVASGPTIEQAARSAKDALALHYSTMQKDGDQIPAPSEALSKEDSDGNAVVLVFFELPIPDLSQNE